MIKFRCGGCEKKIGVPTSYAGKVVRCPQCKEPARVPVPAPPAPVPQPVIPDNQENELIWTDDLLKSAAQGAVVEPSAPAQAGSAGAPRSSSVVQNVRPRGPVVTCPRCNTQVSVDSEFCINCGAPMPVKRGRKGAKSASKGEGGGILAGIRQFGGFPMALGAGLGVAILGAMLWAWLVCVTKFEFGFLAWLIGACIGGAMLLFSKEQTVGLGVLASFLAIFSILMGKYYIAKWYVMPELKTTILTELAKDDDAMVDQLCTYMVAQGEMTEEMSEHISNVRIGTIFDSDMTEGMTEEEIALAKAESDRIEKQVASMPEKERLRIVEANIEQGLGELGEDGAKAVQSIGMVIAFIGSFSLFDILWVIFAVASAYKVARGSG
ncbi:MAG: zinc ribbon domain-containing protein [Sedimentisphaerales bacterium]|nr:zinc ribbon domain-containing protein [Sedimentisphaerales bacterium]